jgi:hypothetical protein
MIPDRNKHLDRAAIEALSSPYVDIGVKQDRWEFKSIAIEGKRVTATLRMTSFFVSPTDPAGFHLTIFSTQEFIAQLANIFLHVAAGYDSKCRETWMRECSIVSRKVIRDPENIQVEMTIHGLKQVGESLVGVGECRVFDDQGGLFTARMKGLLR